MTIGGSSEVAAFGHMYPNLHTIAVIVEYLLIG